MKRAAIAACAGLVTAVCLVVPSVVDAHEVQPMIATVAPSGSNANYRLMIRNTDAMPITLEINPYRVTITDEGTAVRTPEDADVILFPPQIIVQPGGEQAIQIRYVGDPSVTEGRLYAVVVSQLPVDFTTLNNSDNTQTQVKIGFDFVSHMVVQPPSAKANLVIGPTVRQANNDLAFDVSNTGDGVALLRTAEWTLVPQSGAPVVVDAENVAFGAFGAILPGGKRSMTIPAAQAAAMTGNVTVAIHLK